MSDQTTSPTGGATPPPLPSETTAVAPPPFPPVAAPVVAPAQPTPPKKRHGCLIALIVALVLMLGLCGVAYAFISNLGKPRDLGVRYTVADYHSAAKKVGLSEFASAGDTGAGDTTASGDTTTPGDTTAPGDTGGTKPGSTKPGGTKPGSTTGSLKTGTTTPDKPFTEDVTYTGSKKFDTVLTSAEMSALLNYSHMPGWPISEAQVVFTGENGFAMSMYFEYAGTKYPVYATGTAGITGGTLSGIATSAEVMGVTIPGQYLGPGSEVVLGVINDRLSRLGTLNVTTAEVVDGGLHLVGIGPKAQQPAGQ